jgi:uncharacterized protein YodC (DUF2158 family)
MSKNNLDLFKIGSTVKLTDDVYGTITAICIRGNNYVTYECSWWNGRSHDNKWFHENELELTLGHLEKTRIGFL